MMTEREEARYKAAAAKVDPKTQRAFLAAIGDGKTREQAMKDFKFTDTTFWGILLFPPKPPSLKALCREEAKAVSKEVRQAFLDKFHAGGESWEGMCKGLGISTRAALGIIDAATKTVKVLSRTAK